MPRYTDIDLLIDKVEGTDWYHISKQGKLVRGANSKDDIPLYKHSDIKEVLNNAPIADVVPKSEEGAECPTCHGTGRIGTTNWLTKNMTKKQIAEEKAKSIAEHEQHIKAEVAREIFEEIDSMIFGTIIPDDCAIISIARLAELKKKHTEDEKNEEKECG